jgi:hypothetical protein
MKPDQGQHPCAPERRNTNVVPFKPYVRVPVKTMNDLCATDVWHCGGLGERLAVAAAVWLAAVMGMRMGKISWAFFDRIT